MELNEALDRISDIKLQLVRTEVMRDFRSVTVAASGLLGIVAAAAQAYSIPHPAEEIGAYILLWIAVAVANLLIISLELISRWRLTDSSLKRRLMLSAAEQFLPCLVAGASVTVVVGRFAPSVAWMLPGLWSVIFGLGLFACARIVPREIYWVGAYYLASGSAVLAVSDGPLAFSPWLMVGTFGIGQLLTAIVLYISLERHGEPFDV